MEKKKCRVYFACNCGICKNGIDICTYRGSEVLDLTEEEAKERAKSTVVDEEK